MAAPLQVDEAMAENQDFETESARIHADLLDMARFVINQRKKRGEKIKMTEYLDAILRDTISAHYEEEAVKFAEEHKPKRKKNGH